MDLKEILKYVEINNISDKEAMSLIKDSVVVEFEIDNGEIRPTDLNLARKKLHSLTDEELNILISYVKQDISNINSNNLVNYEVITPGGIEINRLYKAICREFSWRLKQ